MGMRSARTAPRLGVLLLVACIFFPKEAYLARHADYVKRSLVLSGPVAREIAALLGLKLERASRMTLELPSGMEHFEALATHTPRAPSSGVVEELSSRLVDGLSWDPVKGELSMGEHWYDQTTAFPHPAGPRYLVASVQAKDEAGATRGWAPIYRALRSSGPLARAKKDWKVAPDVHLRIELAPWNGKVVLTLAVGPWLDSTEGSSGGLE